MITLYRKKKDTEADYIEKKLQDLVLAYQTKRLPQEEHQPHIIDGGNKISGKKEIEKWFIQLSTDLKWQRSLSGDGCYIDPETGTTC